MKFIKFLMVACLGLIVSSGVLAQQKAKLPACPIKGSVQKGGVWVAPNGNKCEQHAVASKSPPAPAGGGNIMMLNSGAGK